EIVGTTVTNTPNSFLVTDKEYGDFILELEFKVNDHMNSGIQIRSESTADYKDGRVHGYQVEIDPSDRAGSEGIYDEARRCWLYYLLLRRDDIDALKHHEWHYYRVEAVGNAHRTRVNGVPTDSLVDDMTVKVFIVLQVNSIGNNKDAEGEEIGWRNIRIEK